MTRRNVAPSPSLSGKIVRYAVVGIAISAIYSFMVMFFVALLGIQNATLASIVGFGTVAPIAYAAHRYVTFSDVDHDSYQPLRFAVTAISNFLVTTVGMYVVTEVFGRSYVIAIALNWIFIPAVNFGTYLVWVFPVRRIGTTCSQSTRQRKAPGAATQ